MVIFHLPGQKGVELREPAECAPLTERALWIDLVEPSRQDEVALEKALGIDLPTREEMQEIELSRRLYREGEALFTTATVLTRSDTSHPVGCAITFVLVKDTLITIRYENPVAFQVFSSRWEENPSRYATAPDALAGLIDAMVERLADILESTATGIDRLSLEVLSDGVVAEEVAGGAKAKPPLQRDFKVILRRIGRYSDLASRVRESLVSIGRLVAFLREEERDDPRAKQALAHLKTVGADLSSLGDHATFLSSKVAFLLDATLGLINNEQNAIIKIVSVAAVVFLPPTLVASIYGMNFEHMPELKWLWGYPFAGILMVVSAILPYLFFKRKGWL